MDRSYGSLINQRIECYTDPSGIRFRNALHFEEFTLKKICVWPSTVTIKIISSTITQLVLYNELN